MYTTTLRPLRPASEAPAATGSGQVPTTTPAAALPPAQQRRKKPNMTRVACNECRARKTACNGARPICLACQARASPCVYVSAHADETRTMALKRENEALKRDSAALEELLNHLRHAPDRVALSILAALRASPDSATILQCVRGESLNLSRISEQKSARAVLPCIQSEHEFELMAKHPFAYPTFDPSQDGFPSSSASHHPESSVSVLRSPSENAGPPPPPCFFDPRMSFLDIAFWTTVPVSNQYAAAAISLYLETDHPIHGLLDPDLFIGALVDGRFDFCSPFLVSSMLAYASQAYTSKEPEAARSSYEFESEAEKLCRAERLSDSLTTIAGLVFLSMSRLAHGQGKVAAGYLKEASRMATKMKLFGVRDGLNEKDISSFPGPLQIATMQTAWGAFNTISMYTMFYLADPTEYPPALPIPGCSLDEGKTASDESQNHSSTTTSVQQTFASSCLLWTVVCEIMIIYRHPDGPKAISLAFAQSKYYKILSLAESLPSSMACNQRSPPYVLVFHGWYHVIILEIFRPFISAHKQHGFQSWSLVASFPESVFAASLKQLKHLVVLYTSRHACSAYCMWSNMVHLNVANSVLKDTSDQTWRLYFLLCIRSYQSQYKCYAAIEGVVQGLLTMAIECGAISASEAQSMYHELSENGSVYYHPTNAAVTEEKERGMGGWMVDLELAMTDRAEAMVDSHVDRFSDIKVFEELTDGIV